MQSGPPPIPPKVPGRPEPSPAREGGHYRHYPAPTDAPQYPFPAPGHQGAPYPPHGDYRPGGPFVPPKRYSATPMPQEYHQQPPGPGEPRYDNAGVSVPPKISNNSANFLLSFINSNDSPIAKLEKIIDGCNLTLSHDLIAIMDKSTYAKDSERSIASAINKLKERRVGLLGYFAMYLHTIHKDDVRILKDRVNFLSESLEGAVQYIKSGPTIPPAEIVLCANPQQNKYVAIAPSPPPVSAS